MGLGSKSIAKLLAPGRPVAGAALALILAAFAAAACGRVGFAPEVDAEDAERVDERGTGGSNGGNPGSGGGSDPLSCPGGQWREEGVCRPIVTSTNPLATGERHTCVLSDGQVACTGANGSGQLGLGDQLGRLELTAVVNAPELVSIHAGGDVTCGLTGEGRAWCWGANDRGQLGLGDTQPRSVPTELSLGPALRDLALGIAHLCAVHNDGRMWCTGQNDDGQLGVGFVSATPDYEPRFSRFGTDADYIAVTAGQSHSCGLTEAGVLRCAGSRVPLGVAGEHFDPVEIPGIWSSVAAAGKHTCALREGDGSLWCWGQNGAGALGVGDFETRESPTLVNAQRHLQVSAGYFHTCAIQSNGVTRCWGRAVEGQLGVYFLDDQPTPLDAEIGNPVERFSLGRFHTCAQGASVWCTGANSDGQLGLGTTDRPNDFTLVPLPGPLHSP